MDRSIRPKAPAIVPEEQAHPELAVPVWEQAVDVSTSTVFGVLVPNAPSGVAACGVDPEVLLNLALKMAAISPQFSTESAARQLHLPLHIMGEILEQLRSEKLIDVLGEHGPLTYRYRITQAGQERGEWLMSICGYVGPAPVSVPAYTSLLAQQLRTLPPTGMADVMGALEDMVLPEQMVEIAGLAASSGRSLFLYGPPGNGKTTLSKLLHRALRGELWIPHCLAVESHIIRVFDRQSHVPVEDVPREAAAKADRRWVRVRRPLVIVGGELALEDLDLTFDAARGYYEAPLHFKANGGIFVLDDFGCQRTPPQQLLNRWIIPLEQRLDYLTLRTGQQIQVPFENMLVISTNQDPNLVMAPALLRRMGYRLCVDDPSPSQYVRIFHRYAERCGLTVPAGLLEWVQARYAAERRRLHGCEPRDLIERVRDICQYRGRPVELTEETMKLAWTGYFLHSPSESGSSGKR